MDSTTTEDAAGVEAVPAGTRTIAHWIDGRLMEPAGARRGDVFDPAQGRVASQVLLADVATVDAAVQAAARAFPGWRDTPLPRRAACFYALRDLLRSHRDEIAETISSEHGKLAADAAGEVDRGLEIVELACTAPMALKGEHSEQVARGVDTYSLRQPLGVCAGITPFNFPAMVPLWMFPIALVSGNTFVLKPSERDPSTSLLLARLVAEAGVPDGVLNVVHGDKEAVDALLDHPTVQAVSFVGSTPIARHVYERAAAAGKRVQALGGAKNHLVVLPDADLDQAADAAVSAAFGSAGQRCMAISVAVAVGPVADALVEKVAERAKALRTGPATGEGVDMGPVVSGQARDRVRSYIDGGVEAGARLVRDGREVEVAGAPDGFFVGPTVFDEVRPGMAIYDDEVFGPLLGVVRVESLDEALELVNASPYGNGAAIFTRSGGAARRFQTEVSAGMVGINVPIPVPVGPYSFGGWNDSLFGDTHLYGPEGFHFYTRGKVVTSRWPDDEPVGVNLVFPSS
jgi:malonate-semialdehyde dehydrogenase (acetylating)/methylmalonate-semialdehyde dehydrogenase